MATTTIHGETLAASAVAADEILFWSVAGGFQRRITKANFVGAVLTGGGTINTGGNTLTVPASGTAALLGAANAFSGLNTFSALSTFSGGINLGQATNLDYYNGGNWTPVVADAASGGNVATTLTALGVYQRFGLTVHVVGWMENINTTGLTAGNSVYIRGLPFVSMSALNYYAIGHLNANTITWTGYLTAYLVGNSSALNIGKNTTGANATNLIVSNLSSGISDISFSLTYFCAP